MLEPDAQVRRRVEWTLSRVALAALTIAAWFAMFAGAWWVTP